MTAVLAGPLPMIFAGEVRPGSVLRLAAGAAGELVTRGLAEVSGEDHGGAA